MIENYSFCLSSEKKTRIRLSLASSTNNSVCSWSWHSLIRDHLTHLVFVTHLNSGLSPVTYHNHHHLLYNTHVLCVCPCVCHSLCHSVKLIWGRGAQRRGQPDTGCLTVLAPWRRPDGLFSPGTATIDLLSALIFMPLTQWPAFKFPISVLLVTFSEFSGLTQLWRFNTLLLTCFQLKMPVL